jgi:hypothetical protein
MKWFGIILFFIGVMVAISAGAKMPEVETQFPNTMPLFFVGVVLGMAGLVIWHFKQRQLTKMGIQAMNRNSDSSPIALVENLVPALAQLSTKMASLNEAQICEEIDHVLDRFVLPLADVRKKLIDLLGMRDGADILVTIAFGERMLNRVWSAASDGHLVEARSVFPEALEAFTKAKNDLSGKI